MRGLPTLLLVLFLLALLGVVGWQLAMTSRQQAEVVKSVGALRQEQQKTQEALEEARASVEALQGEQEKMRVALARDPQAEIGEASSALREDLVAVSSIKVMLAEYYMSMGHFPASQEEAGLPAPERYQGRSLRSATVGRDGRVELLFDGVSGVDGGRIELIPDVSRVDAMGIQWRCVTHDYPLIVRAAPGCEYIPSVATEADEAPAVTAPTDP